MAQAGHIATFPVAEVSSASREPIGRDTLGRIGQQVDDVLKRRDRLRAVEVRAQRPSFLLPLVSSPPIVMKRVYQSTRKGSETSFAPTIALPETSSVRQRLGRREVLGPGRRQLEAGRFSRSMR